MTWLAALVQQLFNSHPIFDTFVCFGSDHGASDGVLGVLPLGAIYAAAHVIHCQLSYLSVGAAEAGDANRPTNAYQ